MTKLAQHKLGPCPEGGPHLSKQSWGARLRQEGRPAGGHGTHLVGRGRPGLHLHITQASSGTLKAAVVKDRYVAMHNLCANAEIWVEGGSTGPKPHHREACPTPNSAEDCLFMGQDAEAGLKSC